MKNILTILILTLTASVCYSQTVSITGRNGSGSTSLQTGSYSWSATLNTSGGGTLTGSGAGSLSANFTGPSTRTGSLTSSGGTINLRTQMNTPQGVNPTVTITFTFTGGGGGGGGGGGSDVTQADLDALEAALRLAIADGDTATTNAVLAQISVVQDALQAQIDQLNTDLTDALARITALENSQAAQDALIAALQGRVTALEGQVAALEARATDFEGRIAALEASPGGSSVAGVNGTDGKDGDSFGDDPLDYLTVGGIAVGSSILASQIAGLVGGAGESESSESSAEANNYVIIEDPYADLPIAPVEGNE